MGGSCASCKNWRGDQTTYMAVCALLDRRTQFDEGCSGWVDAQIQRGTIMQPAPSEPIRVAPLHVYIPHTLEIQYEYYDTGEAYPFRSYTPVGQTISGTTWIDSVGMNVLLNRQEVPFRLVHKDTLIAFDGYITEATGTQDISDDPDKSPRWLTSFISSGESFIIKPFTGGDMEAAVVQAKAAKEEARRKAEEERKNRITEWAASQPDEYEPDYLD